MVRIAAPPPTRTPRPLVHTLTAAHIVRIFDPTDHGATATGFRFWGPRHRFDHHRAGTFDHPADDADCGIYYAALDFDGCLVELFGDMGEVDFGERHVAYVRLRRAVRVLDLRGPGAMRAGANAALAKVAERPFSQEWSRYFYEQEAIYSRVDGLICSNAHNDAAAVALYERAADALDPAAQVMRLDQPALRPLILRAALDNGLDVPPLP